MGNLKKHPVSMSPSAKSSIALFFASLVSSGISYMVTPVYTRILPEEVYGQAAVFMTWFNLFGIIAMFGLANGVFNNGMADWPDRRDEYSFSLLILSNLITVAFGLLLWAGFPILQKYIRIDGKYLLLMMALFLFQPAYNFWTVRQRYEYRYKHAVLWTILCAVVSPAAAILCITLGGGRDPLGARIFGAQIPLLLIYGLFYFHLARKAKYRINRRYWKAAFFFNLPLLPHYLSMHLLSSSDRIMISYLVNDNATAYYSVAYSVAALATMAWSAVNSSLIPFTYENCKQGNYEAVHRVTKPIIGAFAVICVTVIMMAPEVVSIMATPNYMEAIYAIPPIVGGVFFQIQYFMYANVVYYYKKPKYVMAASVISTLFNLVLNYIFIRRYGYIAAGYTTLLCYMLQAAIDYFAMRKVTEERIYDTRLILALSGFVCFVALISNTFYHLPAARYLIAAVMAGTILAFRKKIIASVAGMRKRS